MHLYIYNSQLSNGIYLKLQLFVTKTIRIKTDTSQRGVLKGLNSSKFLELLNGDKTRNKFSTYRLKVKISFQITCASHS